MSPLHHAAISYIVGGKRAVPAGTMPDVPNLLFIFRCRRLPDDDWRVKLSRITHSPLVVLALLVVDRQRFWPYALHWVCDAATHPRHQWMWPFVRRHS